MVFFNYYGLYVYLYLSVYLYYNEWKQSMKYFADVLYIFVK